MKSSSERTNRTTPAPSHRSKAPRGAAEPQVDSRRLSIDFDNIQNLDIPAMLALQSILGHGDSLGIWQTSADWIPPATRASLHCVDLRGRIVHFLPESLQHTAHGTDHVQKNAGGHASARSGDIDFASSQSHHLTLRSLLDAAVLELTRYLLLLRVGPAGLGPRGRYRPLDPNTVVQFAYSYGPALFALAVQKNQGGQPWSWGPSGASEAGGHLAPRLLSALTLGDLDQCSRSTRDKLLLEWRRMQMLQSKGLWRDVAATRTRTASEALASPARENSVPPERESHLPLPDEYVARMGRCSLWLSRELTPNLLEVAKQLQPIWTVTEETGLNARAIRDRRRIAVNAFLRTFVWRDSDGNVITMPPFTLRLPKDVGFGARTTTAEDEHDPEPLKWPPRSYRDLAGLFATVQRAHYFIVALAMGARQSEALSLKQDCVVRHPDGQRFANGKTYKLVERPDGEVRDWLLPDAAADALEQQARLVDAVQPIAHLTPQSESLSESAEQPGDHMWALLAPTFSGHDATRPLKDINRALVSYAKTLGMDINPGGQRLRSHRFRKTLARIVALAMVEAPQVLMDVFGHKAIEMTLGYILTDPAIRSDIETVAREVRIMRAKEVVQSMIELDEMAGGPGLGALNGYGGLAAVSLRRAIETERARVHRRGEEWNANNVQELAQVLTLNGTAWSQVRRGVLCTKLLGTESGPCNRSLGRPEPSKCRSDCQHRLEEGFLRSDVDSCIREAIEAYRASGASGDELVQANWAGQIRAHVGRFPDLRMKWMSDPTVQEVVTARSALEGDS